MTQEEKRQVLEFEYGLDGKQALVEQLRDYCIEYNIDTISVDELFEYLDDVIETEFYKLENFKRGLY